MNRLTYICSKDDTAQIAVDMTDELHALCWGRLGVSNVPHDCPTVTAADPFAWVRAQRVEQQVSTPVRLAGLRDKWLNIAADITMGRAA